MCESQNANIIKVSNQLILSCHKVYVKNFVTGQFDTADNLTQDSLTPDNYTLDKFDTTDNLTPRSKKDSKQMKEAVHNTPN